MVPAKEFGSAKSRLSPHLSPAERAALAEHMLFHVVSTIQRSRQVEGILVLAGSPQVGELATKLGTRVLLDPEPSATDPSPSLAAVVDRGARWLEERGVAGGSVFMADLPGLETADVQRLVDPVRRGNAAIAPDSTGMGTNALGLYQPWHLTFAFGAVTSFSRHLEALYQLGATVEIIQSAGLAWDLDEASDRQGLAERRGAGAGERETGHSG